MKRPAQHTTPAWWRVRANAEAALHHAANRCTKGKTMIHDDLQKIVDEQRKIFNDIAENKEVLSDE